MPPQEPTHVAIGRYVLDVGGDAGTLITLGDAAVPAVEEDEERWTPADTAEDVVDSAEEVTDRVDDAIALFNAVVTGRVELEEVQKRIEPMLAMLGRLDKKERWKEALQLARAVSRLVALVRRWVALLRLLGVARRAASELGDEPALAWAQHELGTLHLARGELTEADACLQQAREIRQRLEDADELRATDQSLRVFCRRVGCRKYRHTSARRRLVVVATALQK